SPAYHPDAFAARLSPDGATLVYGTFLGGVERDFAYGVAVDASGAATVAGSTRSADFPTTAGAYDPSHHGQADAFVAHLAVGGGALAYSTFLGGSDYDHAQAVTLGADGAATVTGSTFGAGFPTTPGAYDPSHNGGNDAFV